MLPPDLLTIGQLAKRGGVRTSTLRYYEQEGLLTADARSESGYRLYRPEAEKNLRFIQRAQRLGFSLADIKTLWEGYTAGDLSDAAIIATAEARFLALQRQLTEQLVVQHELGLFLQDLHHAEPADQHTGTDHFDHLLARVCHSPQMPEANSELARLLSYTGCRLQSAEGQAILAQLAGLHVHVWQDEGTYHILVVSEDTAVEAALRKLVALEQTCHMYTAESLLPRLHDHEEGFELTVTGEHAFIYARLFLALERES